MGVRWGFGGNSPQNYKWVGAHSVSMEAKDLIQKGDVFANDFEEYEVISFAANSDRVKVENLAGMEEWMEPRELIEVTMKEA